jgi:hypothetical protein
MANHKHHVTMRTKVQETARALERVAYLADAELYDPDSLTWNPVGLMHAARDSRTATLLPNPSVLVKNGYNGGVQSRVEIFGRCFCTLHLRSEILRNPDWSTLYHPKRNYVQWLNEQVENKP